jgi:hypothetical protein
VKYSFLQTNFEENHISSRVLYREIINRVWLRLGKKRRKYEQISTDPNEWSTAFHKLIFMNITPVQNHSMEQSYSDWNWARYVENICKYLSRVKYSIQSTHCNENHSNSTVLSGQIPSLIEPGWENVENTSNLSTYIFEYSTAYNAEILATPTVTREYYVETSPPEC